MLVQVGERRDAIDDVLRPDRSKFISAACSREIIRSNPERSCQLVVREEEIPPDVVESSPGDAFKTKRREDVVC